MERLQTKLLKANVGLHRYCKGAPVLKALNVNKIETTVEISLVDLIRTIVSNTSRATSIYTQLFALSTKYIYFLNLLLINIMPTKQEWI